MSLTVDQLVQRPELVTHVIAGRRGAGQRIEWAHVCELSDPWLWVGHNNLLMTTGLGVPRAAEAQVEYVERLAAVGAAGVAVGEQMHAPPLHAEMLAAADRHALPLLLTRRDIPFIALARAVAEANAEAHLARLGQTEQVYEVLRRSSEEDLDLATLLRAMEAEVGCRLLVVDAVSSRSLVPGEPLPDQVRWAVGRWSPGTLVEAPAGDPSEAADAQVARTRRPATNPAAASRV